MAEKEEKEKALAATKWAIKVKHKLHNRVVNILDEAEKRVSNIECGARFQDLFGVLNYKLIDSCFCVLHNEIDKPIYGELYITKSFVGFYGFDYATKKAIRTCISFSETQLILKASLMKKKGSKHRVIVPLIDTHSKPSVIQFCTFNREVYQFYAFGAKYDGLVKLLFTKWKEAQMI